MDLVSVPVLVSVLDAVSVPDVVSGSDLFRSRVFVYLVCCGVVGWTTRNNIF